MTAEHHPFAADRPLRLLCTCGQPHIVAEHIQTFGAAQEAPNAPHRLVKQRRHEC